jgi:uncharacterized membrane protein
MMRKVIAMKNIAKRAINLLPIWAVIAFVDGIAVLINEQRTNDSLYFAGGIIAITLVLNYVFFGALTLWHKFEKEQ